MIFSEAIATIKEVLSLAGTDINAGDYDGIIVKKLAASNTLDAGRTSNQTHIAITGAQMDIFPYLCADGYFYEDSRPADVDLKKYFVIRVPVTLRESNLRHLGYEGDGLPFDGGLLHTATCVVRSKRNGQADQLQVSMLDMDGEHFVVFRRLMHEGTFFILLKRRASMEYDAFGINTLLLPEETASLSQLNNKFFKKPTNTVVDTTVFDNTAETQIIAEPVPYEEKENGAESATRRAPAEFYPRVNKLHPLNCILYGAPGTGKTYATAEYALAILENREVDETPKTAAQRKAVMEQYRAHAANERVLFTTFHQSYGYEDFIQGLRPAPSASGMEFKPMDGVFKRIVDTAMNHPENNYVIIIDEINRANISKVFGELITLIEEDKRWGEVNGLKVTLPSGDRFAVPNNLYIVGTMNSADKSISLIDTALRRRFEFIEVVPNPALVGDPVLRSVLERLNASLVKELDSTDLLVGHAYFVGKTEDDLCEIFNRSIIPLLYEYFYDNSKKVKAQIKNALPGEQYLVSGGEVGRMKVTKA